MNRTVEPLIQPIPLYITQVFVDCSETMAQTLSTGIRVVVVDSLLGSDYIGRTGLVTSVADSTKLPIHVTLDGETWETDFAFMELEKEL